MTKRFGHLILAIGLILAPSLGCGVERATEEEGMKTMEDFPMEPAEPAEEPGGDAELAP